MRRIGLYLLLAICCAAFSRDNDDDSFRTFDNSGDALMIDNFNIDIGPNYYTVGSPSACITTPCQYVTNTNETHDKTIQRAFDNINKIGGGTVHVLRGTYILYWNLFIGDNVHFKGDGMYDTVFKLADNAPAWRNDTSGYKKSGFVRARLTTNFIASNFTLDGNKQNQLNDELHHYGRYGLFTEGCNNVWFDNVRITNFQGYGFDPHGWKAGGVWGQYLYITNCLSEENEWDGYTLDQTFNIYVHNCTSRHNGRHGFNIVTGSRYVTLRNNTAIDNGFYDPHGGSGCGYMLQNNKYYGTSFVQVIENFAAGNKKADACVNDVHNVVIRDNNFTQSCTCFHAVNALTVEFTHNTCETAKFIRSLNTTITENYGDRLNAVYLNANNFTKSDCDESTIDPDDIADDVEPFSGAVRSYKSMWYILLIPTTIRAATT
jgi:hypothetical protein